jgi:hypothetical protein
VLHAFCAKPACADGAMPVSAPAIDPSGALIGSAPFGGDPVSGLGVVYSFSGQKLKTVHAFCKNGDCDKGSDAAAALIADGSGNYIGATATGGGPNDGGVIYEITP